MAAQVLDNAEPLPRDPLAPFRMSVIDRFRDMGTIAMGKSECGVVRKGDQLYVMPNKCAAAPTSALTSIGATSTACLRASLTALPCGPGLTGA